MLVPAEGQVLLLDVLNTHIAWVKASKEIADQELLQTVREFHACKQEEGQSISSYVLKMKSYIDNLERLSHAMTQNLSVSLILVSLRKEYDGFMQNYNMHSMVKTVTELHAMLKLHEQTLPPKEAAPALHAIRAGRIQKNQKKKSHKAAKGNQEKGKAKMGYAPMQAPHFAPKPKNPLTPKKDNPSKDVICHQCGKVGHWRRNCPIYLAELIKKMKLSQGASTSGALSLYVGDGHLTTVEAIGEFHLCLLSGLVLSLHNCHYALSITRGIISVLHLYKDGFVNRFENDNSISVSRNILIYFNAIPRDDIYENVLSSSNTNDSSVKKRIEKLQDDGLLNSTDIKSFEKCVSCMSGKMARKPYSHQEVENQLGKTIKSLRSDRGGKYMSQEFLDHLKEHGIISHRTPPYTPQHNGVSEMRNRILLDMALVKHDTLTKPDKLEPRSIKCIFVGYPKETIGYSFYYPPENKVFVARNAEFLENSLIAQEASGSLDYLEIIQEEDTHPSIDTSLNNEEDDQEIDEPQSDINPIRRSTRTRRPTDRLCLYVDAKEHELGDLGEPANYKATLLDLEFDKWLNAMNVEMQSMRDNKVWELVDLPPNGKTVGHKWLFKKKTNMDDIRAIRILIAIAAFYDYEI
nr:zinc finger, CCHC-type [Tanacetum cinerariifolium]